MSRIEIRPATIDDAPAILAFINELAIYEKAEHEVRASVSDIRETLFGSQPQAHALMCSIAGKAAGFAVYFYNYSTWLGRRGLYLEDLYISPEYRKQGGGRALLVHLARLAREQGCGRFEWSVLDWNSPAIEFYQSIGARAQEEWTTYRLDEKGISELAGEHII